MRNTATGEVIRIFCDRGGGGQSAGIGHSSKLMVPIRLAECLNVPPQNAKNYKGNDKALRCLINVAAPRGQENFKSCVFNKETKFDTRIDYI